MSIDLDKIVSTGECQYIEYKRNWYWNIDNTSANNEASKEDFNKNWGEFIKDFLALTNANVESVDYKRYLVIGYDEIEKKYYNVFSNENEFKAIKKQVNKKITTFISNSSKIKYKFTDCKGKEGQNIILISIEPPQEIHSLIKDIQTKTIPYRANSVLCRMSSISNKSTSDSVGIMSPYAISTLKDKLNKEPSQVLPKSKRKKSISETINSYLESNVATELSKDFPKTSNDSEKYYELYEIKNISTYLYFLYISENSMQASLNKFKEDHPEYSGQEFLVLIDKPTGTTKPSSRKANVKTFINEASLKGNIEFIDEFGKSYLYKKHIEPFVFKEEFHNTNNFIDNNVYEKSNPSKEYKASEIIHDWFQEEDSPIIVLTGMGGVGKTTLAKYFLNKIFKTQEQENYVLFLDSSTLIDKLKTTSINSIYDLYKANSDESKQFTEQLFKLSIDNGSFVIVLDGLDEIISRMHENFQLHVFLNNIYTDYCFNSAKTKIIITCRDSIWDEALSQASEINNLSIKNIYLKPFNKTQANEFFSSCFKNKTATQKRAMSLVNKLIGDSEDRDSYNPFMLDTVKEIISDNSQDSLDELFLQEKSDMEKLCLATSSSTDFLIYAVCKREFKKLGIPLNKQIELLCQLCICELSDMEFNRLVEKILKKEPDEQDISLLIAHPFLFKQSSKITLRYDFLREFFTWLFIAQQLTKEDSLIDDDALIILEKRISYLNSFSKEVGKRTFAFDKDLICLNIINNIEKLSERKNGDFHKFISSLFLIYLGILSQRNQLKNQESLDAALIEVFGYHSATQITNLCLCNIINPSNQPKLAFNFSNLEINNFYIDNYSEFYNCKFNEKTFFKTGTLNLIERPNERYDFEPSHFSSQVTCSESTKNIFEKIKNKSQELKDKKETTLLIFLKKFFKNGRFQPKKVSEIKAKQGQVVSLMLDAGVIIQNKESKLTEPEYIINPIHKASLHNYHESSIPGKEVLEILKRI